jgi:hypothetical protein
MNSPDRSLVVAHHHPGRLRVRARALQADPELRRRVADAVAATHGVSSVADAATGSVLVEYDPRCVDAGALLREITATASLSIEPPAPPRSPAHTVFESARALNAHVAEWSAGRFDLRFAVPAALAAGSLAAVAFGAPKAPRWDSLVYWSFTVFRALNDERFLSSHDDRNGGG